MAIRIPGPENIGGAPSLAPQGPMLQADTSAIGRGVQTLGAGVEQVGNALGNLAAKAKKEQDLSDVSLAEADYMKGIIGLKNDLSQNNDYTALGALADNGSQDVLNSAAERIRDPKLRQSWQRETELKRLSFMDDVQTRAIGLRHDESVANFQTALDAQLTSAQDAQLTREERQASVDAGLGSIERAKSIGLITPSQYVTMRDDFLTKANQGWAINHYKWMMQTNPEQAASELNAAADNYGIQSMHTALTQASNGGPVQISPEIAALVAKDLKDASLPLEPALQAAYLANPKVNAQYASDAITVLARDKFKGDMGAAIVALAPGSTMEIAAQFAANHDASKLPDPIRKFYQSTLDGMTPASLNHMPIVADPKVHLDQVNPDLLSRYESLQTAFGKQLVITSGYRDPAANKQAGGVEHSQHIDHNAIDIDWSNLTKEERLRFLQTASAVGFTGLGIYENHVHLDMGSRRAWGPSTHADSIPAYAAGVVSEHMAGKIEALPPPNMKLPPAVRLLTPDQRVTLAAEARSTQQNQSISLRSSIEAATNDAPAAIALTGSYNGPTMTPADFVGAYGAQEGVSRYRAYSAALDVAQQQFQFRTASDAEINAAVEAARPTNTNLGQSSGAEVASARFTAVQQAAQKVREARAADPASYVQQNFASVGEAWKGATTPEGLKKAISATSIAERQLGIAQPALLPKSMADGIAAVFNDKTMTQQDRANALTSVLSAASTPADQRAIMAQLVQAGVPSYVNRAMAAVEDGRSGDATALLTAATADIENMPNKADPKDVTSVNQNIAELFKGNEIGAVFYQTGPAADSRNINNAARDKELLYRAAIINLSNGMNPGDAVKAAAAAFFGPVKVATGNGNAAGAGYRVVIPQTADENTYRQGFRGLSAKVADALRSRMTMTISALPSVGPTDAKVLAAVRDSYARAVIQSGYFTSLGGGQGYVFINPKTNAPVVDQNNKPLVFSDVDVEAAAQGYLSDQADYIGSTYSGGM